MATTTNYGWETADDTDLVKDGALAMRTLGSAIDTTVKALNPSTTLGDIEYRSATTNTNTRLGIGSTGQVLTVASGVPTWATPSSSYTANEALGYSWSAWNPSDNTGSTTNAGSGSGSSNTTNISVSNSSGTLTITFASTGFYLINVNSNATNLAEYTYEALLFNLGGTATRYAPGTQLSQWGEGDYDGDLTLSNGFLINATSANQTLTILPKGRTSGPAGTTSYTYNASAAIVRM
jgi:hypothetical protein